MKYHKWYVETKVKNMIDYHQYDNNLEISKTGYKTFCIHFKSLYKCVKIKIISTINKQQPENSKFKKMQGRLKKYKILLNTESLTVFVIIIKK